MHKTTQRILTGLTLVALSLPLTAMAADQDLQQKVDDLEAKVKKLEDKTLGKWLTIGGDYRFRFDQLKGDVPSFYNFMDPAFQGWFFGGMVGMPPLTAKSKVKNDSLYTNRFGLDLKAKATENVTVTTRFLMYKASGAQDNAATYGYGYGSGVGPFFGDRSGIFDGVIGHVPGDNKLAVDRAYATWASIADQPIWLSIGRRPSTGGVPSNIRENKEKPGNSGVPAILVDYAFDGFTLGWAPDIEMFEGAYTKLCYGRGYENGLTPDSSYQGNNISDTDMVGVNIVPYDTDAFRAEFQYNRAINIFNSPIMLTGPFAGNGPTVNVGDIDWYGLDFMGKMKSIGLNWFISGAASVTHPNGNLWYPMGQPFGAGNPMNPAAGLLMNPGENDTSKSGWAVYAGLRYDIEDWRTKIGFEYNYGSKNWITFAPAADDMWTAKQGTRGNVYEGYIIQELPLKPISSYLSKAFFKVGYQYYDFKYTGSNNWVGAPTKIADLSLTPMNAQMLVPLEKATDLYATFEVHF